MSNHMGVEECIGGRPGRYDDLDFVRVGDEGEHVSRRQVAHHELRCLLEIVELPPLTHGTAPVENQSDVEWPLRAAVSTEPETSS